MATRNREPAEFILAAGVRALYDCGRDQEAAQLVRVSLVNVPAGTAIILPCTQDRHGNSEPAIESVSFTVPLRTLMPPLKTYARRSRVWCALHRPFRWRYVDTWRQYEERGILDPGEGKIVPALALEHGDPYATPIINRVLEDLAEETEA